MFSSRLLFCAAALAAMCCVSSAAHADYVQICDAANGEDQFGDPNGYFVFGSGSVIHGTADGGAFASMGVGTFSLMINTGSGFTPFLTYCIEPLQGLAFGTNPGDTIGATYYVDSLTNAGFTAQEADWIEILWSNAFDLSLQSATNAAAFQAVLWELRQDDPEHHFTDGNFALDFNQAYTLDVILVARGWLDNILDGIWTSHVDLMALTNDDSQNFIAPVSSLPAPGVLVALLPGLALGASRRRRQA